MSERESLVPKTIQRLQHQIREIRETAISGPNMGGEKGDKIYGMADSALGTLENLINQLWLEGLREGRATTAT